jgi:hypothetical protein
MNAAGQAVATPPGATARPTGSIGTPRPQPAPPPAPKWQPPPAPPKAAEPETVFDEQQGKKKKKPAAASSGLLDQLNLGDISRDKLILGGLAVALLFAGGYALSHRSSSSQAAAASGSSASDQDARIMADVQAALQTSEPLQRESIAVSVENGTVTLTGQVAQGYEKEIAQTLTSQVPGVTGVKNRLEVPLKQEYHAPVWRSGGAEVGSGGSTKYTPPRQPSVQWALPSPQQPGVQTMRIDQLLSNANFNLQQRNYRRALAQFQQVQAMDPSNAAAADGIRRVHKAMAEASADSFRKPQ